MYYRINNWPIFAVVISVGLAQATAFDYIRILGAKPDMLLAVAVFFSLFAERGPALKAAISCGLIKDVTSSSLFGSYTASFLLVALILNWNQTKFFKEKISTQFLVSAASYIFMNMAALSINNISQTMYIPRDSLLPIILRPAIYTGALSPFLFFILAGLLGRTTLSH